MKTILRLLTLTLLMSLCACAAATTAATTQATTTDAGTATTLPGYEAYGVLADYHEIFDRPAGTYLVYLYSSSCAHCAAIRNDVLAFAAAYADHPFFSMDVTLAAGNGRAAYLLAVDRTSVSVPALLVVVANALPAEKLAERFHIGSTAIPAALQAIRDGTFAGWD